MATNSTDFGRKAADWQKPEKLAKFNLIFDLYVVTMKKKAYTILKDKGWAEDAVQLTFMKLMHHLDQVEDPYSVKSKCYLNTILVNSCFTLLRKNNRYICIDAYRFQYDEKYMAIKADESLNRIFYKELLEDVQQIPEIYSNLIVLHALYGYNTQQLSEILNLKPATVRKRMQRGREMLQKRIEEKNRKMNR